VAARRRQAAAVVTDRKVGMVLFFDWDCLCGMETGYHRGILSERGGRVE
jgi:hypothetical protein